MRWEFWSLSSFLHDSGFPLDVHPLVGLPGHTLVLQSCWIILELKLQAVVSHSTWMMGTKPWCSAEAMHAVNHGGISPGFPISVVFEEPLFSTTAVLLCIPAHSAQGLPLSSIVATPVAFHYLMMPTLITWRLPFEVLQWSAILGVFFTRLPSLCLLLKKKSIQTPCSFF